MSQSTASRRGRSVGGRIGRGPDHGRRRLVGGPAAALLAGALALAASAASAQPPAAPPAAPPAPSKGDVVPAFESTTIQGQPRKVDFPKGSQTVLLFFLSSCPHCHKMIPEWNRAYERRPKGLEVLGVIMDQEPPGFWSTMSIVFPVVRVPGREFLRQLNVNRAPLALRVAEGGRIADLALGETDPIRLGEIFKP
jgi:thiol-disulfide isomerase/thioredoxin